MTDPVYTSPQVVLVDLLDRPSGTIEKLEAHRQGLLHRAVSVFIFNAGGEWLLQRRAGGKYHSAGLWSNTCCTHPYPEERPEDAARRRLKEEMGLFCPLKKQFCLAYQAQLEEKLTEYEYDHIFTGYTVDTPVPNPAEVGEWKFVPTQRLAKDVLDHPDHYTVWFKAIFPRLLKRI